MTCYNGDNAYDADCFGYNGDDFSAADFAGTGQFADKINTMALSTAGKAKLAQMRPLEIKRNGFSTSAGKIAGHFVENGTNCAQGEHVPSTMDDVQYYCIYADTASDENSPYPDLPIGDTNYAPGNVSAKFINDVTGKTVTKTCTSWQNIADNEFICMLTLNFTPETALGTSSVIHTLIERVELDIATGVAFLAFTAQTTAAVGASKPDVDGENDVTARIFADNTQHLTEVYDSNGVIQPTSGRISVPFLNTFAALGLERGVYLFTIDYYNSTDDSFASTTGDPVILNQFGNRAQAILVLGGLEICNNSGLNDAQTQECLQSELDNPENHLIQVTNNFTKKHDDPDNTGSDPENVVSKVTAIAGTSAILTARTTTTPFIGDADLEFWAFSLPIETLLSHQDCSLHDLLPAQNCQETPFIDYPSGANELYLGKSRTDGSGVAHFALPNDLPPGKYYLLFKEVATGEIATGYIDLLTREEFWDDEQGGGGDPNNSWNQNGHCSDPAYTNRQDCEDNGGVWTRPGTWAPCEEPSWPGNYYDDPDNCSDSPPHHGAPYPLPDVFPNPSDGWVCIDDVCTNPNYPGWECDENGNCNNDDFAPALPGWHCTPDGICKQQPPQHPEIVCDLTLGASGIDAYGNIYYTGLCWEVPEHGHNPGEPWPAHGWTCTGDVCTNPGYPGWSCNEHGNCTPPHGDRPYPLSRLTVSKENVDYHEEFIVIGRDFAPHAPVDIYLHSDPHYLGSVVTNSQGAFSLAVSVPLSSNVPAGEHTVAAEDMHSSFDVERSVPVEAGVKLNLMPRPDFICIDQAGNPRLDITTREQCEAAGFSWWTGANPGAGNLLAKEGKVSATGIDTRIFAFILMVLLLLALGIRREHLRINFTSHFKIKTSRHARS